MKVGDKVKLIESPYSLFINGEVYTVMEYLEGGPYPVYLQDPWYEDCELDDGLWPFLESEVELIK